MSMWQFFAAVDGHVKDDDKMSSAETDELWEWLQSKEGG
jgi:hypothetical protein